jgi:hypothetical protein
VLIGLVAGLISALFLTVTAEPSVEAAIKLEASRAVPGAEHADEVVSRGVQKGVGLFGAYALAGAGFGLLFAAAFVAFRRPLVAGAVLAGGLTVAPWLKYPPNPPAVGDPATLTERQVLYLSVIGIALLVGIGATLLSRRLRSLGWDDARRTAAVVALVAVTMLVAFAVLPSPPDPVNAPATLIWRFRLASLGGNIALWTTLTLGFSVLARDRDREQVPAST